MIIRKKMLVPVLVAVIFGLGAAPSHAALSGGQLVKKCKLSFSADQNLDLKQSLNVALDTGACSGFIGGVTHGVNLIGAMLMKQGAIKKNFICLPQGIHAKTLTEISMRYIESNPDKQNLPAQIGVFEAIVKEFPCNK